MPEMPEIDWHLNFETLMPDWSFEGKKMPDWHRRMPDGNSDEYELTLPFLVRFSISLGLLNLKFREECKDGIFA